MSRRRGKRAHEKPDLPKWVVACLMCNRITRYNENKWFVPNKNSIFDCVLDGICPAHDESGEDFTERNDER